MPDKAPRLGVALGSSFLGFATHHGFLRELVAGGWKPATIAGGSAGAIVAGLYAAGLPIGKMEELFTRPDLRGFFYEWKTPLRAMGTLLGLPACPAVFVGEKVRRLLHEAVGGIRIEDCTTARLRIAVTDLHANRVELRDRGPLVETILASCALPGVIAPRTIDGALLWDGGLGSSVPVEAFVDCPETTHIAAHSILHECQVRSRERRRRFNFAGAMLAGHQLTADELLRWKLHLARERGKIVAAAETVTPRPRLGIPLTLPPPKPWPDYARDFMALGAASARKVIGTLASGDRKQA